MKKLLITTMAAVSVGLCAKAEYDGTKTSFEEYTAGTALTIDDSDVWTSDATEGFVISNLTDFANQTKPSRPDYWATSSASDEKALTIDTDAPLFCKVNDRNSPYTFSNGPIFFDSVVQFTATDVAAEPDSADKLRVWLYTSPEDVATTPGLFGETSSKTCLVVTAGKYDGDLSTSNLTAEHYEVQIDGVELQPDTWHRLTIKAIADIDPTEYATPGFEIWVDGKPVTYGADKKTQFPSLKEAVMSGNETLQCVAFDGKGAVDDIVFTTTDPFAAPEPVVETFALNLSVVADEAAEAQILTVYADGAEMGSEGSYELNVEASNVSAWVYCGEGYEVSNDGATYDENGYWVVPVDISGAQANGTLNVTITVVPAVTPEEPKPFAVTIEGVETSFATLADAIAAANGATIALNQDATLTEKLTVENTAVIDLAGNELTLANVAGNYAVVIRAALTITDSSEAKTGTVVVPGLYGFGITAGSLTIDAGTFTARDADYLIGAWGGTVSISGGDFTSGYCVLNLFAAGAKANVSGGKFTVVGVDPEYPSEVILNEVGGTVAVSGGLFSTQLTDALCAKGYAPTTTPDDDGYFTVVVKEDEKPTVGEEEVEAEDVVDPEKVNSSTEIELPNGWTVVDNEIKDGDTVFATFPSYYTVTVVDGKVTLALNDTVKPVIAESKVGDNTVKPMEFAKEGDKDVVKINVPNRNAKLFYGIKAAASITGLNAATPVWATTRGANPPAAAKTGDAQFFKVVVTDVIK